ncbi:MAG TPA: EcsC family protein [Chitinophagaceae bacterium]|nr:EcsC family protein [Chitinophagaceae bacterium]
MDQYQQELIPGLKAWQKEMLRRPSLLNSLSKKMQTKINSWIPEKIHTAITATLKQMIKGVLFGAGHTTDHPLQDMSLRGREHLIFKKIDAYRDTAAIEGGITGAGGLLMGLADFPILIGIKIKLLFDIASLYGFDTNDYKERIYILHIFELAFSSHEHRRNAYLKMEDWDEKSKELPADLNQFDWRNFQQEYRDYIDLAKIAQLIPGIGAPIGIMVNNSLVKKLGKTAMNSYRIRIIK